MLTARPDADIAVAIVWIDMLDSDGARPAKRAARAFAGDERVMQFHDPNKRSGMAWTQEAFEGHAALAASSLPPDDPLAPMLRARGSEFPTWDCYMFYDTGVKWTDRVPTPKLFGRQVMAFEDGTSLLWMNDFYKPPRRLELEKAIAELVAGQLGAVPPRAPR